MNRLTRAGVGLVALVTALSAQEAYAKKGPISNRTQEVQAQSVEPKWYAQLNVESTDGSNIYSTQNPFGAVAGADRNLDAIDRLPPPDIPPPSLTTLLQTDDAQNVWASFISDTDTNESFKGTIAYNGFVPTQTKMRLNDLPGINWALYTFTNANHTGFAGSHQIVDGQDNVVNPQTKSFIITRAPTSGFQYNGTTATLTVNNFCYDKVSFEIQGRSSMNSGQWNPIGTATPTNNTATYTTNGLNVASYFFRAQPK